MSATFAQHGAVRWHHATVQAADKPSHHPSVLIKLLLSSAISPDVDVVLYLDLDVVCVGSLRSIVEAYMQSSPRKLMGMAHAFGGPTLEFNTGVAVFNLTRMRATGWDGRVREVLGSKVQLRRTVRRCSTNSVVRKFEPCEGWADQEVFNGMNRAAGGRLIQRLPCSINVQVSAGSELSRCLNSSTPPIVLHTHRRNWKDLLLHRNAASARARRPYVAVASATRAELQAARLFWKAANSDGDETVPAWLDARAAHQSRIQAVPRARERLENRLANLHGRRSVANRTAQLRSRRDQHLHGHQDFVHGMTNRIWPLLGFG
eukprot:CAMPEP_0115834492 /NCGR_PEP_ID=MMETSP0287-20121206/3710_1 /TAXON_ID=412157 /ORGANISM="Chrysochromulina rotalis, Strain UIO044" /LENGTH=317 /DNA_ID=CAMNT_0003287927 /DNA_START=75 /DNA_END=1025 /DNA_ORIENTATION=+